MAITNDSDFRNVTGISEIQKEKILDFLQGAIYCWCKNRKDEWFALRDLMGGDNYYWKGTPMIVLYEKHINKEKEWDEAVKDAAKDAGWLLKYVLIHDKRSFDSKIEGLVKKYRWIEDIEKEKR